MIDARPTLLSGLPISGAGQPPAKPADQDAPTAERLALREAAQGFEAIMIRRMLETARAGSFGEETPLTGGGRQQFETMRDEHLADATSQTGGFGFARSIEEQLSKHLAEHKGA